MNYISERRRKKNTKKKCNYLTQDMLVVLFILQCNNEVKGRDK